MATTLEQQVEDLIGEDVAGSDIAFTTLMLDQWMIDAVNYIISLMPAKLLHLFSNYSAEKTANGYAFEGAIAGVDREADVHDAWTPCKRGSHKHRIQIAAIATAARPWYFVYDGVVDVKPDPGATTKAFKVLECVSPSVDASADSAIANFPNVLEYAVILYASMQVKLREVSKLRRDAQDEFEALKVDFTVESEIQAKLTAAWNLIQGDKPASGYDTYDILNVNEDPVRVRVTLETAKTALEIAIAEEREFTNIDQNKLKQMEGLFLQSTRAMTEYNDWKQEFKAKIAGFIGGKFAA